MFSKFPERKIYFLWWFEAGSNCRPSDLQSDALTDWAIKPGKPQLLVLYRLYPEKFSLWLGKIPLLKFLKFFLFVDDRFPWLKEIFTQILPSLLDNFLVKSITIIFSHQSFFWLLLGRKRKLMILFFTNIRRISNNYIIFFFF